MIDVTAFQAGEHHRRDDPMAKVSAAIVADAVYEAIHGTTRVQMTGVRRDAPEIRTDAIAFLLGPDGAHHLTIAGLDARAAQERIRAMLREQGITEEVA